MVLVEDDDAFQDPVRLRGLEPTKAAQTAPPTARADEVFAEDVAMLLLFFGGVEEEEGMLLW